MGSFSNYLELEILDHVLMVGAFIVPTNIYIALSTADPLDDASGLAEPVGGAYARVLCNTWDAAVNRATQNTASLPFVTATGNWGIITHFAIMDAIVAGNMLAHGAFAVSKSVTAGLNFTIAAGELDVSFNAAGVSNYLANKILDHVFKVASYTPPLDIFVALILATVTDSMSGSSISEPPINYGRIIHNTWDVAAGAAAASENTGVITFAKATTEWGRIEGAALLDAAIDGNLLWHGTLTISHTLAIGDTVKFIDGALDVTLD